MKEILPFSCASYHVLFSLGIKQAQEMNFLKKEKF